MDIYSILKKDHETLRELLSELISLDPSDDYSNVVIEQIRGELIPHSRAEESVLYNAIRVVDSDKSEVMHSFKEHMEAETLLRTLQLKDSVDLNWKNTAIKLRDSLEHHIADEESKIFNEAKTIFSDEEAEMMGKAFQDLKSRVEKEGFMKTSFDLVANLMPPRFVEQVRSLGTSRPPVD